MKYPIEKYKIVVHQNKKYDSTEILAYSTYAGKVVHGKAICHANDNYDEQKGIKLAVARCAEKIARKRQARATKLLAKAQKQVTEANKYATDMMMYLADAKAEVAVTQAELNEILKSM